jgi:hypothetical protein
MDDVRTLLDAIKIIERNGCFNCEPWDWFDVEAEVKDWDDYRELLHKDVPEEITTICREAGLSAEVYHLKDGVDLWEYVVLLSDDNGREYTLMLNVTEEFCDNGEGPALYRVWIVDGTKGSAKAPVYYHQVPLYS